MMCARVGMVTGMGLAGAMRQKFPRWVVGLIALALLIANTINIASDLSGMADAAQMLGAGPSRVYVWVFGLGICLLTVWLRYQQIAQVLKWLAVALFAYVITAFLTHPHWPGVLHDAVIPSLPHGQPAWAALVAILGTTISPYLFFWQASEEVEEMHKGRDDAPLISDRHLAQTELRRIRWDTWSGMFYSDLSAYFIILATAVTLNRAGITDITTAAQAASALRPLAGHFAFLLFALGILAVGFIGVPVLAGSGAYALSEAAGWNWGLERKATDARGFYGVIAVSVLAALVIQYSPISPMKALFWSAVINGIVAVPLMVAIILLVSKRSIMGRYVASRPIIVLGWITTAIMGLAAAWMLIPG
jgi:Mn2+/Fe2+ NRAMP family transporter